MKNQLFNKRIPSILGIGFVILGIVLTTIIIKNQTSLRSKASSSEEPQNVKITNISDDSFTITYQTDAATTGSVNYGKGKELGNTELEELDKEKESLSPKKIHSIAVKKLAHSTKYHLVIISGQNTFLNSGVPFEIVTAPNISSPFATHAIIKGKIVLPDGNPPSEALVFLSSENSQLFSTLAKNGEFNFSLKSLRSSDLTSYLRPNENIILELLATNGSLKSTVLLSLNEVNSIPTITLSNDYNFTHKIVPIASKSAESEFLGFPVVTAKPSSLKPQILTPKKDQSFTDQKPQFRGTSLPNEKVQIIIHSDENIQTQVIADSNGNWTYRPPNNLSLGEHTITIKTRDSSGILTTIMQSFTVFAATPSATPTQKVTPTSTPTPTHTPTPFPSPTIIILTPTFTPTATLIPTSVPIETKAGLPPTGDSPILLIIGGIITAISGIALFLLTRTVL